MNERSKNRYQGVARFIALLSFGLALPAEARSWQDALLPPLFPGAVDVMSPDHFTPLSPSLLAHPAFDAMREGRMSLDQAVKSALRDGILHPLMGVGRAREMKSFATKGDASSLEYRLNVAGVPLCGDRVIRAHRLATGDTIMVGMAPSFDAVEPASADQWPLLDEATGVVSDALVKAGYSSQIDASWRVLSSERCIEPVDGGQREAWNLTVSAGGWNFRAVADDRDVFSLQKGWFDATGNVYKENKKDASTVSLSFDVTSTDGTLSNTHMKMAVGGTVTLAKETTPVYDYATNDKRFEETTCYYHGNRHMDFLIDMGFVWPVGSKSIIIKLFDDSFNKNPDNAMYQPSSTGAPIVYVGNGSGTLLANLTTDSDVVSHELGHHVLYQTLTKTEGESLVVHEGVADFFTYARSGDSCLGESICIETSGRACQVKYKCLRTGDPLTTEGTPAKLDSTEVQSDEHLKGQVVSAFLWDLRGDTYGMPVDVVTKTLIRAVSLLGPSSGFHDLVSTLIWADKEMNDKAYGCKIFAAADARGFGAYIKGIDCNNPTTTITGASQRTSGTSRSSSSSGSGKWFQCGVIGGRGIGNDFNGSPNFALLMLIVLAPLAVVAFTRRQVRVRVVSPAVIREAETLRRAG